MITLLHYNGLIDNQSWYFDALAIIYALQYLINCLYFYLWNVWNEINLITGSMFCWNITVPQFIVFACPTWWINVFIQRCDQLATSLLIQQEVKAQLNRETIQSEGNDPESILSMKMVVHFPVIIQNLIKCHKIQENFQCLKVIINLSLRTQKINRQQK